jgi:fibro-slime domain-containing protein/uncharacterized repeat protein (TIGR01451 family)
MEMKSIISKNKIFTITFSLILLSSTISIPFHPNEVAAIDFNSPQEIVNPNPSTSTEFGHSLTEVNDNLAVGVPKAQVGGFNNAGQVHIFNGATGSFDKTINPTTPAVDLNFGASVSGIGNTDLIAVRVPGANSNDGQILIFDTTDGSLILTIDNPTVGEAEQMGRDQIDSINDDEFLVGVSLGDVIPGKIDAGKVYHLKSLSVFDSTRFIAGAYGSDDTGSGSTSDETGKAFAIEIPTGTVLKVFDNPNGLLTNTNDQFGWSVSSMTDRYVITAPFGDTAAVDDGMFAIYEGDFDIFGQVGNDFGSSLDFGYWVDARNGLIAIGAPGLDFDKFFGGATDSGLVRVYNQDGNLDQDIFNPADPISEIPADDRFGSSFVFLNRSGSTNLVVSSPFDSTEGPDAGVVWNITEDTGTTFVSAQLDITSDDPLGDNIVSQTQLVTYTYTLQNLGTATLQTTSVASVCSGFGTPMTPNLPDPILPRETRTFTCAAIPPSGSSHIETTDVTVSDGTNSFTCNEPEVNCNTLELTITQPSMTLAGVTVPSTVPPGGTSIVTYTVTNTGNVDLNTSLSVDNPTECVISPTSQIISSGLSGTFSCTVTGVSSDITITGTATATDPPGDPVTSVPPSIPVTITVGTSSMTLGSVPEDNPVGPDPLEPGSGLTDVDFTVTNTGSFALTDVTVTTDASTQGLICTIMPVSIPSIPPGGTGLFECEVKGITGAVTLTSTADSNEAGPVTDDIELKLATPNITITNIAQNPNPGPPLDELPPPTQSDVTISWSLENFGNIAIDDPDTEINTICIPPGPTPGDDANDNNKLDTDEVWNYTCDESFTQIGNIPITIAADSQDEFSQQVSDSETFDVIISDPQIQLDITSDPVIPAPGQSVELTFTITNIGNVDVDGIFVDVDLPFESCNPPFDSISVLPVGSSVSATCTITAANDDFGVSATANASGVAFSEQIIDAASIVITVEEPVNDITLVSIIRDFSYTHPDMQQGCGGGICNGVKLGLVKDIIGLDDKPVFNQDIDSTNGPVNFNQWFNHIPNTNQCIDYDMVLEFNETTNTYSFLNGGISGGFFPIDGFGFGTQGFTDGNGVPHNFHFTLQAKGTFDHLSGQFFEIGGADDDVFVFINGKLASDLGGVHPASQASAFIDLDNPITQAKLGITLGQQDIAFDIFFAERQTVQSHLEISTNITFEPVSLGQCDAAPNTADLAIEKTGKIIQGGGSSSTIDVRISQSSDDAEEDKKKVDLDSSDLDINEKEFVGLRFNDIEVPQGAAIINAYVKFTVEDKKGDKGKAAVKIFGEDVDDATTFTSTNNDISDRTKTSSSVTWDIPNWKKGGQSGDAQTTPNLSSIIQEVVDRNGWASGNSISLIIEEHKGNKDRDAKSYDKSPSEAALLHIEFENENSENELIYTIVINNNGPEDAINVQVIDNLPEEVVATSVEPTPECEIIDDVTVICDFSSLSVGSEEIITIHTTVNSGITGTIVSTASVSSELLDPNPTNDQTIEETTIGGEELFCGRPETEFNVIEGTQSKDRLRGTNGDDLIFGYEGADKIYGLKGDDCIFAGEGNDTVNGNQGDDEIHGGKGKDRLRGNHGNDVIFGDENNDRLYGGSGNDYLDGGSHDKYDRCVGGSGIDTGVNCEKQRGIEN